MRKRRGANFPDPDPFSGGHLFWDLPEQYASQLMSDFHNIIVILYVLKHSELIYYTFKAVWLGSFLTWDPWD